MNSQSKYISTGLLYVSLLIGLFFLANNLLFKHTSLRKDTFPTVTYDDLMSTPEVSEGKVLFEKNCTACHLIHATDQFWYHNIIDNSYDKADLYGWIRNSDSVIKSGNKYYNAVFNEYNQTRMTSFPNLTDKQIDKIIYYIKVEKAFKY